MHLQQATLQILQEESVDVHKLPLLQNPVLKVLLHEPQRSTLQPYDRTTEQNVYFVKKTLDKFDKETCGRKIYLMGCFEFRHNVLRKKEWNH